MMYLPICGTRVIAIGGPARSGKDSAALAIASVDPLRTLRVAFSDAISTYCRVQGHMTKREPRLLQEVGYALRQTSPSVWLDAVYWRIEEARPRLAVITGVRFPDELAMVRDMGGTSVWVERVRADGTFVRATDRDLGFPTETALTRTDFDRVLLNPDGAPERFRLHALELFRQLCPPPTFVASTQ
jgi:hypothetical protein